MLNEPKISFKFPNEIIQKSREEGKEKDDERFHEIIERDKEFILNCYRNQPFYKDSMSKLEKASKGIFYYKRMVKGSLKNKSSFIRVILQSIAKVNQAKKKPPKKKRRINFNVCKSPIEEIKKRKLELEKRNKMKLLERENSDIFKKINFSSIENGNGRIKLRLLSAGKNVIENFDSNKSSVNNKSRINSSSKNRILSGLTKNLDSISTKNRSLSRSISSNSIFSRKTINNKIDYNSPEKRIKHFNYILSKCQDEIAHGNRIGGKFEKFTNEINDNLANIKQNRDNKEDNNIQDQKIIEEKVTNKQKYKLLEIEKFKELKKRIDAKISDNYVYFNRKEYAEKIKDKRKEEEYDLYLENINKIIEEIEKKKIKEKEKFHEVDYLLEDVYKKKQYLKNKINNYRFNRIMEKEKEQYMKDNIVFNDDFFFLEEKKQEDNKGTLIPKLLLKKQEIAKMKKNIIGKTKVI
jgi:hypothetical protein